MSTPARVGKNEWRAAVKRAREANAEARTALKKLMGSSSPLVQALVTQVVFSLADNDTELNRLEEIGRNAATGDM